MRTLLLMCLLLTACRDERRAAPTAEESDQLNAAEELLNTEAGQAEGPEDRSPGPAR